MMRCAEGQPVGGFAKSHPLSLLLYPAVRHDVGGVPERTATGWLDVTPARPLVGAGGGT
jgi:hypothetical protein